MFKRSRQRIVASIMLILVLLFLGTLVIIYGSSYHEVYESNQEMLNKYVKLYSLEKQPGSHPKETSAFQLSTFYSVALSKKGEILALDNEDMSTYGDEELAEIAIEIMNGQKKQGIRRNLIFMMSDKGGYTLVAFMDNTIMQKSMTTLFRYTLVFGSAAILLFFFLAVYLAKKIVQPLEESYQKQRQFVSDAGHELKTPVAIVSANAELLSREIGDNQWLSNIQYENERMGALVIQLLELARTENVIPEMEPIDFSRLVCGAALPFEGIAFEDGIVLAYEIADGVHVSGNPVQLKQLTSILLDNAIRHCSDCKEIRIILKTERNSAVLSVINDGEEIPRENCKRIFERFYRLDPARNGEDQHYGLGLAIAKAIVAAHRGKIDVQCYKGKVEFTVRLPLQK